MDQSLSEKFCYVYDTFSDNEKKIWRYLRRSANKFIHVNPTQDDISQICECSRITVNRSIKKFQRLRFLDYEEGFYGSNRYFIPFELLAIDLDKDTIYKGGQI